MTGMFSVSPFTARRLRHAGGYLALDMLNEATEALHPAGEVVGAQQGEPARHPASQPTALLGVSGLSRSRL